MKVKQFLCALAAASFLLFSCGDQKDCCVNLEADYSKGIFVVNEGPFGGTGTISWHQPETGETVDSLFEKANNGAVLGQFVQSIVFHQQKAYIVVNGANRVVIVDAKTFQYLDTIGGLALPRFFIPVDDHTAYISQWGLDGLSGSVAKVDLHTNEVVKVIPTGRGAEKMLRVNNLLYVANSGGYGVDSTLTAINLSDDSAQAIELSAGINPAMLALNTQTTPEQLVYLCKGYFNDPVPMGRLDFLVPGTAGVDIPAYSDDLVFDGDSAEFFFVGGGQVYRFTGNGTISALNPIFTQSAYGLGYDADQNLLYCADAKDFASQGEVVVYNTQGIRLGAFRTGVAPGEVVIQK